MIELIANKTGITKADVERVMNEFVGLIPEQLKKQGSLNITNLGTFRVNVRKHLVNPQTGERLKGKSVKYVSFSQGTHLKGVLNSTKKKAATKPAKTSKANTTSKKATQTAKAKNAKK